MSWNEKVRRLARPNVLLTLVAICSGWGALAAGRGFLEQRANAIEARAESLYRPRPVVVARKDLSVGDTLSAESLAMREMPVGYLPGGALGEDGAGTLIGRQLAAGLRRGDPVTTAMLRPSVPESLAEALPPGTRALTLSVDEINSQSGLIVPGDRVDLYLAHGQNQTRHRLSLLLEDVRVLATGGEMSAGASGSSAAMASDFGTLTLLVTADDAGRIILAQRSGSLSVVLRPAENPGRSQLIVRDSRQLLQGESRGSSPTRHPASPIELLLGGEGRPTPRREWLAPGIALDSDGERS